MLFFSGCSRRVCSARQARGLGVYGQARALRLTGCGLGSSAVAGGSAPASAYRCQNVIRQVFSACISQQSCYVVSRIVAGRGTHRMALQCCGQRQRVSAFHIQVVGRLSSSNGWAFAGDQGQCKRGFFNAEKFSTGFLARAPVEVEAAR